MARARSARILAAVVAGSFSFAAVACSSDGEDDAGMTDTTSNRGTVSGNSGAPVQGDPQGANTGAGGDAGGGAAVDPGGNNP